MSIRLSNHTMVSNSLQHSNNELDETLRAYTAGELGAAEKLLLLVDENGVAALPHDKRAILMDAIMSGKSCLDERATRILKAALAATSDERFLATRGMAYLEEGEQFAAETLLEWRTILTARKNKGGDAHINAVLDLADVYLASGKTAEAAELRVACASLCQTRLTTDRSACTVMLRLAKECFDASDYAAAEKLANKCLAHLKNDLGGQIDCLRVLHALAQHEKDYEKARSIAVKIQTAIGRKDTVDEIGRLLQTYLNLPDQIDLKLRPDGIDLATDHFPNVILECNALDLEKYFVDAFSQVAGLTPQQRADLAAAMYGVMLTVTNFSSSMQGAVVSRSEITDISLPPGLSGGYVQTLTVGKTVTFRLVPNAPDEATFLDISGITLSVGGKLVAMTELNLRAVGDTCIITPRLGECGCIKQGPTNPFEALKRTGKDFLVGLFLKNKTLSMTVPIDAQQFHDYLMDSINFKRVLHFKEKDLLSFFERCSHAEVDDPLVRSVLEHGTRLTRNGERLRFERAATSTCDFGSGVTFLVDRVIDCTMKKDKTELIVPSIKGIECSVAFDAPPELSAIGLDLRKSLPQRIVNLTVGACNTDRVRRIVVGTAPQRWIGLDLDENMQPALDKNGNWVVFGVTSNPISGDPQNFYLRLDRNNEIKMTTKELAALVNQTAMEGFDPSDPMTWQWGAVAVGAQTLLVAGEILRSTIGDEATEEIAEEVQEVAKFIRDLFF